MITNTIPLPDITVVNLQDSCGTYENWLVGSKINGEFWDVCKLQNDIYEVIESFNGVELEDNWTTSEVIFELSAKGYVFYKVFTSVDVEV